MYSRIRKTTGPRRIGIRSFAIVVSIVFCFCLNAHAGETADIKASFSAFCEKWMKDNREASAKKIKCRKSGKAFVAEYSCGSKAYDLKVKETGSSVTPYIGILTYKQETYTSTSRTLQSARSGPYQREAECPVTELFIYNNGKWEY